MRWSRPASTAVVHFVVVHTPHREPIGSFWVRNAHALQNAEGGFDAIRFLTRSSGRPPPALTSSVSQDREDRSRRPVDQFAVDVCRSSTADRTPLSATGSPPTSRSLSSVMSAPMRRSTSITPVRRVHAHVLSVRSDLYDSPRPGRMRRRRCRQERRRRWPSVSGPK